MLYLGFLVHPRVENNHENLGGKLP
jgi:hypothetical protein